MNKSTTFSFSPAFLEHLKELSEKLGKTKTAVIVDAVNAYASGTLPDRGLIERLDHLTENDAAQQKAIDELKTLILQVLKNQQTSM